MPKTSATGWLFVVTMHKMLVQSTKLDHNSSFMPMYEFWSFPRCYAAQNTQKSPLNAHVLKMASKFTPKIHIQITFILICTWFSFFKVLDRGLENFFVAWNIKQNIKIGTTKGKTTQIDP